MTPGWSQTSSRSSAPGRGPRSFFGRARTKVSCPSSSSAERVWRPTTGWPRLNHLLTTPTRMLNERPRRAPPRPSTVRSSFARRRAARARRPRAGALGLVGEPLDRRRELVEVGVVGGDSRARLAPGHRVDADPVDAVEHDLVHRRVVVGDRRHPEGDRLVERQAEALPARRREADVAARELAQVLGGRQVLELDLDPRVAAGRLLELAALAVDLAADQQAQVLAAGAGERLDDLGERLALAHEAARDVEADVRSALVARRCGSATASSSGWHPQVSSGLSIPSSRVALLLGAGERVDDVVGLLRRLGVLGGEVLPDEAPDRPHPAARSPAISSNWSLLSQSTRRARSRRPALVLGGGDVRLARRGDAGLVPDRVGDRSAARAGPCPAARG